MALGLLVEAWIVAQEFWKMNPNGIPRAEWARRRLSDLLIKSGLAEDRGDFIYMCGSQKQFSWLIQRVEAGKRGGMSNRGNHSTISEATAKRPPQTVKPPSPALPPSPTQKEELKASDASAPSPSSQFIGSYVLAYRKRYGEKARPDLGGKVQGGIKRLLSGMPLQRACEMIQVFLQMDDQWFLTKAHDFGTFEQNLTKVGLALDTGKSGGMADWERDVLAEEARKNGTERFSNAGSAAQELLWGETLSTGAGTDSVARGDEPGSPVDGQDG